MQPLLACITVGLLLAGSSPRLSAQSLTDADVGRAMAIGKNKEASSVRLHVETDLFDVTLAGSFARIARAAEETTARDKPFGPDDVTAAMRADVLVVTATPKTPSHGKQLNMWKVVPPAREPGRHRHL